jgi:hypothetical protein
VDVAAKEEPVSLEDEKAAATALVEKHVECD